LEKIGDPEAGKVMDYFDDRVRTDARVAGTFPSGVVNGVPRDQRSEDTVGPWRSATGT
jgi:hypothetical protein